MGLSSPASHHRRRSSALCPTRSLLPGSERMEDSGRSYGDAGYQREEQDPLAVEETDASDLSSNADTLLEMEPMSSDNDHDDEETGLTAQQRRRRRRRRKQRRELDARIADVKSSRHDFFRLGLADRNVIKTLLVNAILILMWYFFSLSISVYNKWMFDEDDVVFPFPLFTTSLHMAVQFSLSALLLWLIPSLRPRHPAGSATNSPVDDGMSIESQPVLTKFFYLTRLVPCGAATSLDIGLGNMSLKFISLTFLTMCKSSALAFVLLFAFLFRLETPSVKLIVIIATMTVGVVMMVAGETAFNALGFALVIASAFFSGFRWGLTQILLLRHPATSNPFSTLFFLTPVMFLSLIVIALSLEGPVDIYQGFNGLTAEHGGLLGSCLLLFPGALAFCMITSEFALLKRSSVVTLSICGIFKEVVTISAAGVVFHDRLTAVNVSGLIITIGSITAYNYMKISKMRNEARNNAWSRSASPDSDSEDLDPIEGDPEEYHPVASPETGMINSSPAGQPDGSFYASPAAGGTLGSYRVRASGAMHGLNISTSPIPEDDGPDSPTKSTPPIMDEARLPSPERFDTDSPNIHSSSSVSPSQHQIPGPS